MLLCRLVQLLLSLRRESGDAVPRCCRRHLARCPECRAAVQDAGVLELRLRAAAPATRRPPSPFLAAKIVAATRLADGFAGDRPRPHRSRFTLAFAATAAVVVSGFLGWHWFNRSADSGSAGPALPPVLAELEAHPLSIPDGATLLASSAKLDEPLEREWTAMLADARSAADSLAAAFLPQTPP